MSYLASEWLTYKTQWANCDTNKVFHIGNMNTNMVESQHSSRKSWYNSSDRAIDTLFEGHHASIEGQVIEIRKALDDSCAKVLTSILITSYLYYVGITSYIYIISITCFIFMHLGIPLSA